MTQTPEGEKPKEENASTNKENKESKDKEKDDSEIKLNRTRRALERIRGRRLEKPPATKRLSQPNILNNPKFALLIQQMGGKLPGMPPLPKKESKEEKEEKEEKIEVVKDNPDDIIMNKPVTGKNNYKKKPSKTVFVDGVEVVEEVSDEDEKNEEKSKKENEEMSSTRKNAYNCSSVSCYIVF